MRFSISTAYLPTDQLVPIAKAADALGYDSLAMPDHVVDLETLATPYPYTPDGARRWGRRALARPVGDRGRAVDGDHRLRFFTSVYVPAARSPFQVAKSVGTAAVISGNRVALGSASAGARRSSSCSSSSSGPAAGAPTRAWR